MIPVRLTFLKQNLTVFTIISDTVKASFQIKVSVTDVSLSGAKHAQCARHSHAAGEVSALVVRLPSGRRVVSHFVVVKVQRVVVLNQLFDALTAPSLAQSLHSAA